MVDLKSAERLARELTCQRLIKIVVGSADEEQATYMVQDEVLRNSSEYFKAAIKNNHLGPLEDKGALHFPDDKIDVWQFLLFWIINRQLPSEFQDFRRSEAAVDNMLQLLCRCWMAADRYLMPCLQDLIMLELLRIFSDHVSAVISLGTAREMFIGTSPDSPLRKLAAEELVWKVQNDDKIEMKDLAVLDGAANVAQSICHGYLKNNDNRRCLFARLEGDRWKEYMVGDGIKEHWVFDIMKIHWLW